MADQQYVISFAAEVDEGSLSQLQSLMGEISGLAESLASALSAVSGGLSGLSGASSAAAAAVSSLSSPFAASASSAQAAADAVNSLVSAYNGLSTAAPTGALEITLGGSTDTYESGQKSSSVADLLSTISSQISRFFTPTGSAEGGSSGGGSGESGVGLDLALNLEGAQEQITTFLSSLGEEDTALVLSLKTEEAEEALTAFLSEIESAEPETVLALETSGAEEALSGLLSAVSSAEALASADLDVSKANAALESFLQKAVKPISLTADTSGLISAASSALSSIQSMFSSADLQLTATVTAQVSGAGGDGGGDASGGEGSGGSGASGSAAPKSGTGSPLSLLMSTGGRFTRPTRVEVAEEGSPEYVIPVGRESLAVPLVRQLLSEMSASAREALLGSGASLPDASGLLAASGGSAGAPLSIQSVQAPVNITVTASGSDAEALGQSVYDAAERYLLRTLNGVFA